MRMNQMIRMDKKKGDTMKESKWFLISIGCLISWVIIILCVEKVITAHAQVKEYGVSQEEIAEEAYYDSLELLAICVEAEAGNQDLEGKRMVVDVILNRVDSEDWPDTIPEVIMQPYQFSSYWDGGMNSVLEPSEETFQAVQMELESRSWPGLYYFTSDGWSRYGQPWQKEGDHYFSTK